MTDLTIYVVDDDEGKRNSVCTVLLSRNFAVKSFKSGEEFLERAPVEKAGVVVMDLRMEPGISGLEVFQALNAIQSPLHVVFYSAFGTVPDAVQAMEGGAISWVIKSTSSDELLSKVELAVEKTSQVAARLKERNDARELWRTLAPREKRVAPLYAKGKTAQEIADELTRQGPKPVGRRVIEGHILSIRQKLGFSTDNELLIWMIRNRLPPEAPLDQGVL